MTLTIAARWRVTFRVQSLARVTMPTPAPSVRAEAAWICSPSCRPDNCTRRWKRGNSNGRRKPCSVAEGCFSDGE